MMSYKKRDNAKIGDSGVLPTKENARASYEGLHGAEDKDPDNLENHIEVKIRKAMTEGEFDNLKGKGKPLDLGKYAEVPEHLRPAYHILKNAGFVPEEVRLKKEMETIREKIKKCDDLKEKEKLLKKLAEISSQFHFHMDYNRQFKR